MVSDYEKRRLQNIEDNKRILAELGLNNPFKPLPRVIKNSVKRKRESTPRTEKVFVVAKTEDDQIEGYGSVRGEGRRRSSRVQGKAAPTTDEIKNETGSQWVDDDEDEEYRIKKPPPNRPHVYGYIPGVAVGTWWATRMECNYAGIHRPTVAGIHPGPEGAYSIALSGGYEDDIDLGEGFTYTGEGGRDLKGTKNNPKNLRTAPQSKDQTLSRGNLALSMNVTSGHPVRVIRGYKLRSAFAPEEGYRYDGLYRVEKYWFTTGMSGYGVFKFVLKRLTDQAPPPWHFEGDAQSEADSGIASEITSEVDTCSFAGSQESKDGCEKDNNNSEQSDKENETPSDSDKENEPPATTSDDEQADSQNEEKVLKIKDDLSSAAEEEPEIGHSSVESKDTKKVSVEAMDSEKEPIRPDQEKNVLDESSETKNETKEVSDETITSEIETTIESKAKKGNVKAKKVQKENVKVEKKVGKGKKNEKEVAKSTKTSVKENEIDINSNEIDKVSKNTATKSDNDKAFFPIFTSIKSPKTEDKKPLFSIFSMKSPKSST